MIRLFNAPTAGALGLLLVAGMCAARTERVGAPPTAETGSAAIGLPITSATTDGVWTDHIVVKLRTADALEPFRCAVAERLGAEHRASVRRAFDPPPKNAARAARFGLDRFVVVDVTPGSDTAALAATVGEWTDLVELAETDPVGVLHSVPSDPGFAQQWALNNTGQTIAGTPGRPGADIDWIAAWQLPHPSVPIIVGIADTGISQSHPDLQGQTVPGRCFVCSAGNEGNTDDVATLSHGTFCGGIAAAASNNAIGVTGVAGAAPTTKLMPLKISSGLVVSQIGLGDAMRWAADHGVSIVSMSLGFARGANVSAFRAGAEYAADAGLLLVASTGNTPRVAIGPPAEWPYVLAVGGTNNRDELWPGTTTGPEMDIVAPAENIWTTMDQSGAVNGYGFQTGTSMACPMVAAVAAIVWAANPALTAGDVRHIIETTVTDLGPPGYDSSFGLGRLNARRALTMAVGTLPQCVVDFNEDGVADIGDLFTFLSIYFSTIGQSGDGLRADFDRSGTVSVDDLFTFMAAWFSGC